MTDCFVFQSSDVPVKAKKLSVKRKRMVEVHQKRKILYTSSYLPFSSTPFWVFLTLLVNNSKLCVNFAVNVNKKYCCRFLRCL